MILYIIIIMSLHSLNSTHIGLSYPPPLSNDHASVCFFFKSHQHVYLGCQKIFFCKFLIAYDNAVRNQKLQTEFSQTKKEINSYLESIERGKAKEAIIERKRKVGRLTEVKIIKVPPNTKVLLSVLLFAGSQTQCSAESNQDRNK